MILLEDLGAAKQIDHILLAEDAEEAERTLFAYVDALARLHGSTTGVTNRYHQIREALGPRQIRDYSGRIDQLKEDLAALDIESPALSDELDRLTKDLREPGPFLAYTHGDSCPDNCLLIDDQVWLLDFEWAEVRHALVDGVFPWIHFPSCWCVNRLPDGLPAKLVDAYRHKLVEFIPEAGDDALFGTGLLAASVAGFANSFGSHVLESDRRWGISTVRQRCRLRIGIVERTAEQNGFTALSDASALLGEKLAEVWNDVDPMPIYPAFRTEQPTDLTGMEARG